MNSICHADIESFSKVLLPKVGIHRYAEDPSTEILVICYAFDDGPVNIWIPNLKLPIELICSIHDYVRQPGQKGGKCYIREAIPQPLFFHIQQGCQLRAHNSQFERVMLNGPAGRKIGFPHTTIEQWVCTAVKAAAHALPRDLMRVAKALDTPHQKDENGKADMLRVTKPRTPSKNNPSIRWTPENSPDRFYSLYTYCMDDVLSERDVDHGISDISEHEQRLFILDQKINDRGWMADLDATADAQFLIKNYRNKLEHLAQKITGFRPTQTEKYVNWIRSQGIKIDDLQKQTIVDILKRKDLPKQVRKALIIRTRHAMKAVDKYTAIERAVCKDGALRSMFMFYGASTGRWSSRIVQLQNLFRPVIKDTDVAIELFSHRSIELIEILYPENPMKVFASCIRGMLISRPGHDLLFCDYSSIEARIVAWMADSKELLEIYRTHGLAYEFTASIMFGYSTDLESLKGFKKVHPIYRFLGKIAVLALGYQGGQAAFVKMSKQFGSKVKGDQAEQIKIDWREANPEIVAMWYDLQAAARQAVEDPGMMFATNKLIFKVVGDYLYMRLPSKRKLAYYKPEIRNGEITFMGIDTHTGIWKRGNTYGGKLLQNACEGIARDLMARAMLKIDREGYPILGTVHDEIITEPQMGFGSVEEVCEIMCDSPAWADGLPVHAEGFRAKRYRK